MKHYQKLNLLLAITIVFLISCKNSDNTVDPKSNDPISINGGDVFVSQVVTISLPDQTLAEKVYQATLDGSGVKLTKSDEHTLLFVVPLSTVAGTHQLVIDALNNTTINYLVKVVGLTDTPVATLASLSSNLNTFSQSLDASSASAITKNNIANFNLVFKNASLADQTKMAQFFLANKTLFDALIMNDYGPAGVKKAKTDIDEKLLFPKFWAAMYWVGAGAVVTYIPEPSIQAVGILVSGIALAKALEYGSKLIQLNLRPVQIMVDDVNDQQGVNNFMLMATSKTITSNQDNLLGSISGNTSKVESSGMLTTTAIRFGDNVQQTMAFSTAKRPLITSDENGTHPEVTLIFNAYQTYNDFVGNANTAIQYVNANVFMANFSLIPLLQVPTACAAVNTTVNADAFSHFTFSVNDPNLSLVSSILQSDGQLNMKIKVTGTPATNPVVSKLNYTYSDDFSTFTGSLPIEVSKPEAFSISIVSGDNQTGELGKALANPIKVLVKDEAGNPYAGAKVNFAANNSGSVSQSQVTTSTDGMASVNWTLGAVDNTQTVSVTAFKSDNSTPLQGSPMTFTASCGSTFIAILTNNSSLTWRVQVFTSAGNDALSGSVIKYIFNADYSYSKTINGNSSTSGTFGFDIANHLFFLNSATNTYTFSLSNNLFAIDKVSQDIYMEMTPQ